MILELASPRLALDPGQVVALDDACGTRVEAAGGRLWITLEGDRRDIVVRPGESFVIARGGRTVVQAVDRAWVRLSEAPAVPLAHDA